MSTGKRLAKRSILGTRVMAPRNDGKFYPGIISGIDGNKYSVRFENENGLTLEYGESEILGPGFESVSSVQLQSGQICYVTHCQREMQGRVIRHDFESQDVLLNVNENEPLLKKIDDVRLLESRKSARLINSDTDFSKLADVNINENNVNNNNNINNGKKKVRGASAIIDVPRSDYVQIAGSRKRRTSENISENDTEEVVMSECTAAMVLMKLSCSPNNHFDSSSGASSFRSSTPSPPLSSSNTDEGIVKDLSKKVIYKCTFPGCEGQKTFSVEAIESHVRRKHVHKPGPREEEFYYNEDEVDSPTSPVSNDYYPPMTVIAPMPAAETAELASLSLVDHLDMARPAHEDPCSWTKGLQPRARSMTMPITIAASASPPTVGSSPSKLILISPSERCTTSSTVKSPVRRGARDGKKCRKVYGLEQRDLWCTQCKWKKACARFGSHATESPPMQLPHQQTSLLLGSSAPPSSTSLINQKYGVKALKF